MGAARSRYHVSIAQPRRFLAGIGLLGAVLFALFILLRGSGRERSYGAAVFYLFLTALHSGFLGVLITLSRPLIYPLQSQTAAERGLAPLEDQQLAGLVMWVPAGMVYAIAALILAGVWIGHIGTGKRGASNVPFR